MEKDREDLTNIDFDNDWKCYCQLSSDKADEKTIVSSSNHVDADHRWSSVELPHITDMIKHEKPKETSLCKWWYCKQFDWISKDNQLEQQIYLIFEPYDSFNSNPTSSNIAGTVWLNNTQIFSGLLMALNDPIELPSKLLCSENTEKNKHDNILVICCSNTTLSLHARLILHGKVIYATGQVSVDEELLNNQGSEKKENDVLDYTVSVDDGSGRIDVVFKSKKKFKSFLPSKQTFESDSDEKQIDENKEEFKDDLIIPRLAIVILIVGTRGDVQPFIA
jgi:hypothetical protein